MPQPFHRRGLQHFPPLQLCGSGFLAHIGAVGTLTIRAQVFQELLHEGRSGGSKRPLPIKREVAIAKGMEKGREFERLIVPSLAV